MGDDWTNVDLSLVAGAPQSFVQAVSQPYYTQRPVVPLPHAVLLRPQVHEPTLTELGREAVTVSGSSPALDQVRTGQGAAAVERGRAGGIGGGIQPLGRPHRWLLKPSGSHSQISSSITCKSRSPFAATSRRSSRS
jgi:hypothetical protein